MKEKFIEFLKKENAFTSYLHYFEVEETKSGGLSDWLLIKEPDCFLDCAFNWENTLEGENYWDDLNEKWLKEIN